MEKIEKKIDFEIWKNLAYHQREMKKYATKICNEKIWNENFENFYFWNLQWKIEKLSFRKIEMKKFEYFHFWNMKWKISFEI
jgi:hypothetical protein